MVLIDLEEAHRRIREAGFREPSTIKLKTHESYGKIIGEDIKAPKDIPSRPVSAMDGYAINSRDLARYGRLRIRGKIFIGDTPPELKPGEAYYIVTGAPLPYGADSIVRVEASRVENGYIVPVEKVWPGKDVVSPGDVVKGGMYLARRGDLVDPYMVSLLLYSGVYEVHVYSYSVGVLAVGSELARYDSVEEIGGSGSMGSKVDSISPLIIGLLGFGFPKYLGVSVDSEESISEAISSALAELYSVITIGGTSVGERDLVKKAVRELGGELLFEGVNVNVLKRGSIGVVDGKPIAMLPGQCVAAAVFFHEFYLPIVSRVTGLRLNLDVAGVLGEDVEVVRKMDSLYLFRYGDDGMVYPLRWGPGRCFELAQASLYGVLSRGKLYRRGSKVSLRKLIRYV